MKKLLLSGSIASLLLPALVFAAYNDVSLSTDVSLSVNGVTLSISGATALIESIVVGATSAVVTLQSDSTFNVSVAALNKLVYDVVQPDGLPAQINIVCTSSASTLDSSAIGETTLTVNPLDTVCADAVVVVSSASSRGDARSGGGGGGTPALQASPVAQLVTSLNFSSMTPTEKQAAISQIRTALIPLIQQLLVLLNQQLLTMQASGTN